MVANSQHVKTPHLSGVTRNATLIQTSSGRRIVADVLSQRKARHTEMAKETITIGEATFTVLFPDLMRPLTERERQELKSSIENYGVKQEVVVDESDGIIDGINRARIVAELGHPTIPTRKVDGLNEEGKRWLCLSLNIARRHLTEEERQQLVEARRQRVKKARKARKSLRTIADEEGVSHEQIRKDLAADSVVNPLTPAGDERVCNDAPASPAEQPAPNAPDQSPFTNEPEPAPAGDSAADNPRQKPVENPGPVPETIKGRDGKSYPRTKMAYRGSWNSFLNSEDSHIIRDCQKALRECQTVFSKRLSWAKGFVQLLKDPATLLKRMVAARDALDKAVALVDSKLESVSPSTTASEGK
jgi:hypothetical protein